MFDPAVLGTLLIGLGANEAEARNYRENRPIASRRRARGDVRLALARMLRRTAALLDRPSVGEVAG